jgi:hypothetical protein
VASQICSTLAYKMNLDIGKRLVLWVKDVNFQSCGLRLRSWSRLCSGLVAIQEKCKSKRGHCDAAENWRAGSQQKAHGMRNGMHWQLGNTAILRFAHRIGNGRGEPDAAQDKSHDPKPLVPTEYNNYNPASFTEQRSRF